MVKRMMAGVDAVVHTAAALPLYSPEEIFTTDVDGTRIVLETARELGLYLPGAAHAAQCLNRITGAGHGELAGRCSV